MKGPAAASAWRSAFPGPPRKGPLSHHARKDLEVRSGSQPVLADLVQRRRLSEVERTSRPRKRTLPLEGRLSGVERSCSDTGRNRRC
jgi:hypothetical protein